MTPLASDNVQHEATRQPRVLAVTNLFPSEARPWEGTFIAQQVEGLRAIGVAVRVHYIDRRSQGPFSYLRLETGLREAVRAWRPHVVHVMYGGVMADRIGRLASLPPIVQTFHGSDLHGQTLSGLRRKVISRYGVHCSRRAARNASRVVVVAPHLARALPDDVPREKVEVIPCGIDLERFRPMDQAHCRRLLKWDPSRFHVVFPENGGDPVKRRWLAEAAVEVVCRLGFPTALHALARIPHDQVPMWLNAADAVVLTSLREGSPTVVKEALACGVPVVSGDVGDVRSMIGTIDGCEISTGTAADFAAKLIAVFQRNRRLNCRHAIGEFSHLAVASKLRRVYRQA